MPYSTPQAWIIVRFANRSSPVGMYQGEGSVGGPCGTPKRNPETPGGKGSPLNSIAAYRVMT